VNGPRASAVVTGGGSGLGRAVVEALCARGLFVVVADLDPGGAPLPTGASFVRTDVTDPETVRAAVAAAVDLAPLRVAVACAGIAHSRRVLGSRGPLRMDEFDRVVRVNLTGSAALLVAAAEAMAQNEPATTGELADGDRGVVILISSIAAFDGGSVAYAASKAGVAGMVLPAAQNLADHAIRVMGIAPGPFATPMLHGLPASLDNLGGRALHPKTPGDPRAFAALVQHIVDNPMLNAEVIRLDGGTRLG
jgi:NAD(P)-dependent dehydrogenase (short-subunit alcohol dehydrogenase family)